MTSRIDELDGRILHLFSTEPRIGVLEASRRLRVARGTVQARLDRLERDGVVIALGAADLARGARLRRDRLRHPGDRAARGPGRDQRPAGRDPRGAGVLDGDRQRRPVVPDRGPLQHRSAAGHRRDGHRPGGGPVGDPDRAGRADSATAPSPWFDRAPVPELSAWVVAMATTHADNSEGRWACQGGTRGQAVRSDRLRHRPVAAAEPAPDQPVRRIGRGRRGRPAGRSGGEPEPVRLGGGRAGPDGRLPTTWRSCSTTATVDAHPRAPVDLALRERRRHRLAARGDRARGCCG